MLTICLTQARLRNVAFTNPRLTIGECIHGSPGGEFFLSSKEERYRFTNDDVSTNDWALDPSKTFFGKAT